MRIRQAASMNLNGYWWIYFIGIFVYYFFSDILINVVSRYFPSGYMVIPMSNLPEEIQKSVAMPQIPVVLFFYVLLMLLIALPGAAAAIALGALLLCVSLTMIFINGGRFYNPFQR